VRHDRRDRRHLDDYLAGHRDDAPPIDFDAIRRRL
jgi:hypothetical protein